MIEEEATGALTLVDEKAGFGEDTRCELTVLVGGEAKGLVESDDELKVVVVSVGRLEGTVGRETVGFG